MTNFAHYPSHTPLNLAYQIEWERRYQQLLIKFLKKHREFDGSAVAAWMRRQGMHDPVHHNMWGAQIAYYAAAKWMTKIGSAIPSGAGHVQQVGFWKSELFK